MNPAAVLCPVVVGRDAELATLRAALVAAVAGRGGLVWLVGQPGIGKSRLARELADRARDGGIGVAVGRAVPAGGSTPYRPWTEALLALLRDRSLPEDAELRGWLPALGAIVPTIAVGGTSGGGGEVSAAVRGEAVVQLLRRLSDPGGVVIVLEDLQWADPDTLTVLEYLADNLVAAPVLCLVTVRSEPASAGLELARRLHDRRAATVMELTRLDGEQVAEMVRACLPGRGVDLAVIAAVKRVADGVPFLVEEVLASPGVPASFADSVHDRLAGLVPEQRTVLEVAAVLGRHFDWRLLETVSGAAAQVVRAALEHGVGALLLRADAERFWFRHALTREAVLDTLLPPQRAMLAAAALAALDAAHPQLDGVQRDVAADLAVQCGDRGRAARLLGESGRAALARGALDTAVDTLTRAVELADDNPGQRATAQRPLIEALALVGRVDEAVIVGQRLITRLEAARAPAGDRAQVHVRLAQAAVAATRWPLAGIHLDAAAALLAEAHDPDLDAEWAVFAAEAALAADDIARTRAHAQRILDAPHAAAVARCHAWELLGRVLRLTDLAAARAAFEQTLAIAETADLALWRLRALHELGTVDLLDHAGTERLTQARARAEQLGALSTAAVLDLQLSAAACCRFDLAGQQRHARAALEISEPLGLTQIQANALCLLTDYHALRGDHDQMQRYAARTAAVAPADRMLEAFCWGSRAMFALLAGEATAAAERFDRAAAILRDLPHANPAYFRGMRPLLAAARADPRARAAIVENRRAGLDRFFAHNGLLGYAEAVLAGRGDRQRAGELARAADAELADYPGWVDLARLLAAEPALADGWGEPQRWLRAARDSFTRLGLDGPARRCQELLQGPRPGRWARIGLTAREIEVLGLVTQGLGNKDIAARLGLSHRTVEKHLEAILRKTATGSRAQLIALALAQPPGSAP